MFSKACEYGIRAILFITVKSLYGNRARLKEIAKEIEAPEAFTAKVLQKLAKCGIIHSSTGPKGGFYIKEEEMEHIKLIQVVTAIDGDAIFTGCSLGLPRCDASKPCPMHHKFKGVRDGLIDMLTNTNIANLAHDVEDKRSFLKY